jgi:hypothetical protein
MSGRRTREIRSNNDGVRTRRRCGGLRDLQDLRGLSPKCVLRARRDLPSRLTRFAPGFALRLRDGDPLF